MPEKTTEVPDGLLIRAETALDEADRRLPPGATVTRYGALEVALEVAATHYAALTAPLREELEEAKSKLEKAEYDRDQFSAAADMNAETIEEMNAAENRRAESAERRLEEMRQDVEHRLAIAVEVQELTVRGSIAEAVADGKRVAFEEVLGALAALQDSQEGNDA